MTTEVALIGIDLGKHSFHLHAQDSTGRTASVTPSWQSPRGPERDALEISGRQSRYTHPERGESRVTERPEDGEGDSVWDRLRRRKVVQWGVAYAAGAWGFQQGLAYVSTLLDWPAQLQKLAGLALLIGLPVVLVIAWYHGDRGQQRVSGIEFAILTLLFLLGGGLFWRYHGASDAPPATAQAPAAPTTAAATPADPRPSIAVLPFENRSRLEDDAFFVDGVHDDILTQLSKASALKVISRTSVERFRDTKLPIKDIAAQLGVKSILEGGVQRGGDRVRINVQLIDANTDAHLWAETYDRELTAANIFAIQSEVAESIAGALKTTLTEGEKARVDTVPTQSLEAWEAYQLGKQRMARRTSESLADAEQFFRKATKLDPTFALAYAGLADTLWLQIDYSGKPREAALVEAERVVTKALELDSNLAEAWASAGAIAMSRAQDEIAERMLRRTTELNPNYAAAHHWLSMVLRNKSPLQEEFEHAEQAAHLDPLSSVIISNLGNTLERMGRYDEAAARFRRAIEIDPSSPTPYLVGLGPLNAYAQNRFADAVPLVERGVALDAGNPEGLMILAQLYLDMDDISQATRLLSAVRQRWPEYWSGNVSAAVIFGVLGENAVAVSEARKALAEWPREYLSLEILRNADLQRGDAKATRARYASAYPELLSSTNPKVDASNCWAAIGLVPVLQRTDELDRASALLDGCEKVFRARSRLGWSGYGIADVQIQALRGDKSKALAALREAEGAGWRGPSWRYYRDVDPSLATIRSEPEFRAFFSDIERDMAQQRARLAARPKDAPLPLGTTGS